MMVTFLPMIGLVPDYNSWRGLAVFMIITIAFASLSYHLVEKPLQNLIRRKISMKRELGKYIIIHESVLLNTVKK